MIALQPDVRVYLACGYTDMRKCMQCWRKTHSMVRCTRFADAAAICRNWSGMTGSVCA